MLILKIKIEKDILIDDENKELVSGFNWIVGGSKNAYVMANTSNSIVYMHRLIMGNPKCWVDHINGNTLDNRKSNLRLCTPSQNRANSKKTTFKNKETTSKYKGVHQKNPNRGWSAEVNFNGKRIYLGDFKTPELAAEARDIKAREMQGEFVKQNFNN